MGSLYIGGAVTQHAEFTEYEHWRDFDKLSKDLNELGKQYNVHIDRLSVNDGVPHFIIASHNMNFNCVYDGDAFEFDLAISADPTFETRAKQFIEAMEKEEKFSLFHTLEWSKVAPRYYVVS